MLPITIYLSIYLLLYIYLATFHYISIYLYIYLHITIYLSTYHYISIAESVFHGSLFSHYKREHIYVWECKQIIYLCWFLSGCLFVTLLSFIIYYWEYDNGSNLTNGGRGPYYIFQEGGISELYFQTKFPPPSGKTLYPPRIFDSAFFNFF